MGNTWHKIKHKARAGQQRALEHYKKKIKKLNEKMRNYLLIITLKKWGKVNATKQASRKQANKQKTSKPKNITKEIVRRWNKKKVNITSIRDHP